MRVDCWDSELSEYSVIPFIKKQRNISVVPFLPNAQQHRSFLSGKTILHELQIQVEVEMCSGKSRVMNCWLNLKCRLSCSTWTMPKLFLGT